jgi:hypothetical protein
MRVIGHTVGRYQFLALSRNDSGDVLLQLLTVGRGNHARTTRNCEDNVQIYLCVGVRHFVRAST